MSILKEQAVNGHHMLLFYLFGHEKTMRNEKFKENRGQFCESIRTQWTGFIPKRTGFIRQRISIIRQADEASPLADEASAPADKASLPAKETSPPVDEASPISSYIVSIFSILFFFAQMPALDYNISSAGAPLVTVCHTVGQHNSW